MDLWIGVDLDGTLAKYYGWKGPGHIGPSIPRMVEKVKRLQAAGVKVKIFTARVSSNNPGKEESEAAIEAWTREIFGEPIPATAEKDFYMIAVYDDRSIQVIPNTGETIIDRLERIAFLRREIARAEDPSHKGFFHLAMAIIDEILAETKDSNP
jgi:hypothetical protein